MFNRIKKLEERIEMLEKRSRWREERMWASNYDPVLSASVDVLPTVSQVVQKILDYLKLDILIVPASNVSCKLEKRNKKRS